MTVGVAAGPAVAGPVSGLAAVAGALAGEATTALGRFGPALAAAGEGGLERQLIELLTVFVIAAGVGVFVAKVGRFPYTIALLIAGFLASLAGVEIGIELTHDVILLVVVPPLLFEGAATTDVDLFRRSLPAVLAMAVVGLALSILVVGFASFYAFDALYGLQVPLLIALLFATIVLPTDPVSVLALFEQMGAPERLSVLVEGESLVNDGVAVVVFSALLAPIVAGESAADLAEPGVVGGLLVEVGINSVGGAIVGFAAGYAVYSVMVNLDEHMTEIVLTVILAYGSFLLAEHYIGVSGVIATVASGMLIGNRGREYAMSAQTKIAVFNTWETAAFVVNTFIFLLLGVKTPIDQILESGELLLVAIPLVLLARAVAVYPLIAVVNRVAQGPTVPRKYQHVLVWAGLHGSIPIALVLGLPTTLGSGTPFPFRQELRVLVFGVAAFSLVVQGLTTPALMRRLGIATESDEEEVYSLLIARARAVDEALEEAERLHEDNAIRTDVYERFRAEYGKEKEELDEAIAALLSEHPELQRAELLRGERRVLRSEESAIKEAELGGQIDATVAEDLLEEVRLKQSWVDEGRTTVTSDPDREGYEEFWRERVRELGLFEGVEGAPEHLRGDGPDREDPDPDRSPMD